jgi:hypothetical protein
MSQKSDDNDTTDSQIHSIGRREAIGLGIGAVATGAVSSTATADDVDPESRAPRSQEDPEPNGTTTSTPEEQDESVAQITPTARVLDYQIEFPSESTAHATATVELDRAMVIVTSDVLGAVASEGVTRVPQTRRTLPSGRATVEMDVGIFDESFAAMSIAAPGGAVVVSTGVPGSGPNLIPDLQGWAQGGLATVLMGLAVIRYQDSKRDSEPKPTWGSE